MTTASSVAEVCHLASRRGRRGGFARSGFRGNQVPGDSGGLGDCGDGAPLLHRGDLALLGRFLGGEVDP